MPGWWWSATTDGHVVFESWVERHHIMEFERAPEVIGLAGRPGSVIRWSAGAVLAGWQQERGDPRSVTHAWLPVDDVARVRWLPFRSSWRFAIMQKKVVEGIALSGSKA